MASAISLRESAWDTDRKGLANVSSRSPLVVTRLGAVENLSPVISKRMSSEISHG